MICIQESNIEVMCLQSPNGPNTAAQTFDKLEGRLDSLKGRRFYGLFKVEEGVETYLACTKIKPEDNPEKLGFRRATIQRGKYDREKLKSWEDKIEQLPAIFASMEKRNEVDEGRYTIEYYRSREELILMLPVK